MTDPTTDAYYADLFNREVEGEWDDDDEQADEYDVLEKDSCGDY